MLKVLITGLMGAGKSAAAAYLKSKKQPIFEADAAGKAFLEPDSSCRPDLKSRFGVFIRPDGEFDRKKLAQAVFQDSEKRKAIEEIIHPLVQEAFKKFSRIQEKQGRRMVFYEASLISESIFDFCGFKILIACPPELRKRRLLAKGWTEREIQERTALQIPENDILEKIDFIIDNSGDLENLKQQADKMLNFLNKKQGLGQAEKI